MRKREYEKENNEISEDEDESGVWDREESAGKAEGSEEESVEAIDDYEEEDGERGGLGGEKECDGERGSIYLSGSERGERERAGEETVIAACAAVDTIGGAP